ncbi:MAG TPA: recombinase family protein [Rhodoglobus sp.]|jgi:DNA invertase Pin-like site-specific DNA recombinase|nr:recombinase family protein [Rhodoglobus sp.]
MRVYGYVRVSTEEQGDSRAGLDAQEAAIRAEVKRRGWELIDLRSDIGSGKSLRRRDNLGRTLRDLADGQAEALVVAKLDRLSRSVLDFAGIMETAAKDKWSLVVLDLGVDTTTPNGELVANIMISMAQWERRIIGDRTKSALQAVQARGTKVGRKPVNDETRRLIRALRAAGLSWHKVADALTVEGVPTGQGGEWHAATVRRIAING